MQTVPLGQSTETGPEGQTQVPAPSLQVPGPRTEGTQLADSSLQSKNKEAIRTFLKGSAALRGLEPAILGPASKRVKLSTWDSSSQGEAKEEEGKMVWPIHFRVN